MSRLNWRKWMANLLSPSGVRSIRQFTERSRRVLRLETLESRRVLSTVQLLNNGNFATGFTGWVTSTPSPTFFDFNGGTQYSQSVVGPGAPGFAGLFSPGLTTGNHAVLEGFDGAGPGTVSIAQDVTIPTNSIDTLSFGYRAAWNMFLNATQPRTFSVDIEPSGGGTPLQSFTVLTAQPNTNIDTGNQQFSVDLSGFAGRSVRISLDENIPESFTGPGQLEIDNVSLLSGSGSEVVGTELWLIGGSNTNDQVQVQAAGVATPAAPASRSTPTWAASRPRPRIVSRSRRSASSVTAAPTNSKWPAL